MRFFKVEEVKLSDIREDEENPNEMTERQLEGLKEAIEKYGFLEPIIIDKDNMVIDGEHRLKALREAKAETAQAIRLAVSRTDARMIRQAMNKLRGSHNPREDIDELVRISREVPIQQMARLLGMEDQNLADYLNSINQVPESWLTARVDERVDGDKAKFVSFKLFPEQAKKLLKVLQEAELELDEVVLVPVDGMVLDELGKMKRA